MNVCVCVISPNIFALLSAGGIAVKTLEPMFTFFC